MTRPAVELPELVIASGDRTAEDEASRGPALQTWRDHAGRVVATGGRAAGSWWMDWPGLATFRFGSSGSVHATTPHPPDDPRIRDVFVRGVTPVVLVTRGDEALHASAVLCEDSSVVALCATSGTGKSTMAYAMAAAGARHFADDTVLYRLDAGGPHALRLPFPVRIDAEIEAAVGPVAGDWLAWTGGESPPLRRVYQLTRDASVSETTPSFRPVKPLDRFEVLLGHAHSVEMGGPARQRAFVEHVLALSRATDVWECRFKPSLDAIPEMASRLLDHAIAG